MTDAKQPTAPAPLAPSRCSDVFMAWLAPLVRKAWRAKGGLGSDDVPGLPERYSGAVVSERAANEWRKIVASDPLRADGSPGCWWREGGMVLLLLWRLWRQELIHGCFWSCIQGLCNTVAKPLLLKLLVDATAEGTTDMADVYVALVVVTLAIEGVSQAQAKHCFVDRFGAGYCASISALLQQKAVKLRSGAGDGGAMSLIGNDVVKTYESFKLLGQAPMSWFSLVGGVVMLVYTIGVAGAIALGCAALILSGNARMAKMAAKVERRVLKASEDRINVLTQIVEGIKAIKLSAWETSFFDLLTAKRFVECKHIMVHRNLMMMSNELGRASPALCAAFAFVCLGLMGKKMAAGDVFAALTVFQALRLVLIMIPVGLSYWGAFRVAVNRIESYLLLPDVNPPPLALPAAGTGAASRAAAAAAVLPPSPAAGATLNRQISPRRQPQPAAPASDGIVAAVRGGTFSWSKGEPQLRDITLTLLQGQRVAVVGAVASGKSSLLQALLGEMVKEAGAACLGVRPAEVGYVPQKAVVMSGTVADNVTMGRPHEPSRLMRAVEAAQLARDVAMLPLGLDTVVGERGVTLSGGQQQRLSIARALYASPTLVVADDPLAAVDPSVASGVFEGLMGGGEGRTIVMAINQLHLLRRFDYVLHLTDGRLVRREPTDPELPSAAPPATADSAKESSSGPQADVAVGDRDTGPILQDVKQVGAVKSNVWRQYIGGMGKGAFPLSYLTCLASYCVMGFSDRWLALWVEEDTVGSGSNETDSSADTMLYMSVYASACVGFLFMLCITSVFFSFAAVRSGRTLHNDCAQRVMRAPMSWFEGTPSGRIISRFASDMSTVDSSLSHMFEYQCHFQCTLVVLCGVIMLVVPVVGAVLIPTLAGYWVLVVALDRFNREMKRLANMATSPVLTTFAETASTNGRVVLRTMGCQGHFSSRFCDELDDLNRYNFFSGAIINWGQLISYGIACIISCALSVWMLHGPQTTSPSNVGLALTYTFMMPYYLVYFFFTLSMVQMAITCLERLLEYSGDSVPQEPPARCSADPGPEWPSKGEICFDNVTLVYRPGLPPAVRSVSFRIGGGEKIGVVGRTGAGKSSIAALLFRIVEATGGSIMLDGIDTTSIGLEALRGAMAVVPQEPLLIAGTLRLNLDPFDDHSDEDLQAALRKVGLTGIDLTASVGSNCTSLSCGQRQLVALARVLLRPSVRVCLMDEPTAQVDAETDHRVQSVLQEQLRDATVITIAHRLNTVMHADRIFVMDAGALVEEGPPQRLLSDPASRFAQMATAAAAAGHVRR